MDNNDFFKMKVPLGTWRKEFFVPRAAEMIYRDAAKFVNMQLAEMYKLYPDMSKEEIYLLLAYNLAITLEKDMIKHEESPLLNKLEMLEKEIDTVLEY